MRTTTHCAKGHERTPENLNKARRCRICEAERGRQNRATHCKRGHPRTPDNLTKTRQCRTCRQEQSHAYYLSSKGKPRPPVPERPIKIDPTRHANNVAGLTHYIQRRRQRLTRHNRTETAA